MRYLQTLRSQPQLYKFQRHPTKNVNRFNHETRYYKRKFIKIYCLKISCYISTKSNPITPQLTCAIYQINYVFDQACPSNFKSELYHFQKQLNCLQRLESTELRNKQCYKQVNNIAFNEHRVHNNPISHASYIRSRESLDRFI